MANIAREIAFINAAGAMDPAAFSFAVGAAEIQLNRDFLPAWRRILTPNRELTVAGYTSTIDLAPGSYAPIEIMASLDRPGFLGDHAGIALTDTAFGRSLPDPVTMSHEALELAADPYGDRWVRLQDGTVVAFEVADMVERDTYMIAVTIGGETRDVAVSNFAYPAWFGMATPWARYDHMGLCSGPGENRGYLIIANEDGSTTNVFARTASEGYKASVMGKLLRPSRTSQRFIQGARPPAPLLPSF